MLWCQGNSGCVLPHAVLGVNPSLPVSGITHVRRRISTHEKVRKPNIMKKAIMSFICGPSKIGGFRTLTSLSYEPVNQFKTVTIAKAEVM